VLLHIHKDEARQQRGKLKLFFGMAAGSARPTLCWMLRQLKADIDVVVGYIETHKRAETEALLSGLEIIPRQKLEYRGTLLEEMDLDAILSRDPQIVLVDELAHTNVLGTRHVKRWQDVVEILETGIGVYTTVNVQHFESRATRCDGSGITVHETVPDPRFADEIELTILA
jgi:two-component system sensor histidine kinase KdpD